MALVFMNIRANLNIIQRYIDPGNMVTTQECFYTKCEVEILISREHICATQIVARFSGVDSLLALFDTFLDDEHKNAYVVFSLIKSI